MDFAIDNKGDLVFSKTKEFDGLNINFRIAEQKGLQLNFIFTDMQTERPSADFELNFEFVKKKNKYYKAEIFDTIKQKSQEIRIKLRTERGEIRRREELGSKLYAIKHEELYNNNNIRLIENMVIEALEGAIPNMEVIAKPEKGIGNFYAQNVGVYIYSDEMLIFKFYI